jgi:hypothetical protein
MPVTLDDLKKCKLENRGHMRGSGWHGYMFQYVEHPRLTCQARHEKKTKTSKRTWLVDDIEQKDLESAIIALNQPPSVKSGALRGYILTQTGRPLR